MLSRIRHQDVVFLIDKPPRVKDATATSWKHGYLVAAWLTGEALLDTTRLLQQGASPFAIALYCVAASGMSYSGFRRACIRALSPCREGQPGSEN